MASYDSVINALTKLGLHNTPINIIKLLVNIDNKLFTNKYDNLKEYYGCENLLVLRKNIDKFLTENVDYKIKYLFTNDECKHQEKRIFSNYGTLKLMCLHNSELLTNINKYFVEINRTDLMISSNKIDEFEQIYNVISEHYGYDPVSLPHTYTFADSDDEDYNEEYVLEDNSDLSEYVLTRYGTHQLSQVKVRDRFISKNDMVCILENENTILKRSLEYQTKILKFIVNSNAGLKQLFGNIINKIERNNNKFNRRVQLESMDKYHYSDDY